LFSCFLCPRLDFWRNLLLLGALRASAFGARTVVAQRSVRGLDGAIAAPVTLSRLRQRFVLSIFFAPFDFVCTSRAQPAGVYGLEDLARFLRVLVVSEGCIILVCLWPGSPH
jgi:hypothetical protein